MYIKNNFLASSIAILLSASLITACSENNSDNVNFDVEEEMSSNTASMLQDVFYQIPAPSEIFEIMKEVKEKGVGTDILNPTDNIKNYLDNKSKSLNFGIYISDLLYTSIFNYGSETLSYFATVKKLADDLGLSSSIDENTFSKVEDNIENSDSLTTISNDLFYSASENLEKNERGATLALVIAGGWVESIYLATQVFPEFDENNEAIQRIADQKLTYENLEEYLKMYSDDPHVNDVLNTLKPLGDVFLGLEEKEVQSTKASKSNNVLVLSGGAKVIMTKADYTKIKEETAKIRQQFIQANI